MESPKNKLTYKQQQFLDGLNEYLDTKMLYYGSIMREDYIPGKSDIDIDIFTDNEESTISKLQHYLKISRKEFKKIVWKVRQSNRLTIGHKIKYSNSFIIAEFSIFNMKYKNYILKEHTSTFIIPLHCKLFLKFLKFCYYHLNILPSPYYSYFKKKTFSLGLGYEDDKFIVL
jgi:hypothetical protein